MSYDPVRRHLAVERLVTRKGPEGLERRYYRVRPARWYGGIVTADCVGCGLLCRFCWVSDRVMNMPGAMGEFYSSEKIARELTALASRRHLQQLRISGGEPTIGKAHLLRLLDKFEGKDYRFILETNGIPLAYDEGYAEELSNRDFLHVRVSLKGCNGEEFSKLTGSKPEGFGLQLKSLERLVEAKVSCHPSVMTSFSLVKSFRRLVETLRQIEPRLADEVEVEELILYPHVTDRVRRHSLKYYTSYTPERVPPEQI